jgi:hypothetical protein
VKHRRWFSNAPAVAAGEFNSNVQWDANRPGRNHTEVVRLFEGHGLISSYHSHHGEKQGAETRRTYYFYRHQDKPFHIDDVFAPTSWRLGSVEVGSFGEWGKLSDHVSVVVDSSIGADGGEAEVAPEAARCLRVSLKQRWPYLSGKLYAQGYCWSAPPPYADPRLSKRDAPTIEDRRRWRTIPY